MSASNYLEGKLMDHALAITTYSKPTSIYMGLFAANPDDTGYTELTVGVNGYARVDVTGKFAAYSSGKSLSNAVIEFPTCTTSAWGDIHGWGIFDASTSGNLLFWGLLVDSGGAEKTYTIAVSDIVKFETGTVELSMD